MKTKIALGITIALMPILAFASEGKGEGMKENMMKRYFGNASSSVRYNDNATSTLNIACINPALDKRENALIAGHDAMNTAVKAALTARGTDLKASYALTTRDARKTSKRVAWDKFRVSVQAAHASMRTVRSNAWSTFNVDMKACGVYSDDRPLNIPLPAASL